MHYLLLYDVVADYATRRLPFRNAHLQHAQSAVERGELLLGGALGDPVDGVILLFDGDTAAVAERFAKADPYVHNGLVQRWWVRQWTTVVESGATAPLTPQPADM